MSFNERRRPPSPRRDTFRFGGNTSQHEFNFDGPRGQAPSFPSTSGQNRDRYHGRDRARGRGPGRGRGRGGWRKFTASDREIFRARRSPTPERMAGMNGGDSRFRVLEDLESQPESDEAGFIQLDGSIDPTDATDNIPAMSDSDDMDMSSEDEHPRAKRARTNGAMSEAQEDTSESRPKWSNPDPYTSLPPPSQTDGPKKDVVAMIRKAKVENADRAAQTAQADEFISLNFDDEGNEQEEGEQPDSSDHERSALRRRAPDGPGRYDSDHMGRSRADDRAPTDRWPPQPSRYEPDRYEPAPPRRRSHSPARDYDRYSPPPAEHRGNGRYSPRDSYDQYRPPRYYDDDDEYAPPPAHTNGYNAYALPPAHTSYNAQPPPESLQPAAGKRKRREGPDDIAGDYLPSAFGDATPWMVHCTSSSTNPGEWLHDELEAFYEYARPRPYEHSMRADLIRRINNAFKLKYNHVRVAAFGSFATNLYLPVSDMDLVAMTSVYEEGGFAEIGQTNKDVRAINRNIIERSGLSRSSQLILHAKVPIIKFTDISTGIHVDVSFENDSGLKAIGVVEEWRSRYPCLPYLVYPIKHFLATRELNDVSTGGLGGFSIICLIAFRLDVLEKDKGRSWLLENLDFVLMDFLDFYGNKFDYRLRGLDMQSMRSIRKIDFAGTRRPQADRILIVDPNNSTNDVSGGSGKIAQILRLFKDLHKRLGASMSTARQTFSQTRQRVPVLKCMLDSGFDGYHFQRERLRKKHESIYGGRDDDVQFVSSHPLRTGRSHDDAIDLTSADNRARAAANVPIREQRKPRPAVTGKRQAQQQPKPGSRSIDSTAAVDNFPPTRRLPSQGSLYSGSVTAYDGHASPLPANGIMARSGYDTTPSAPAVHEPASTHINGSMPFTTANQNAKNNAIQSGSAAPVVTKAKSKRQKKKEKQEKHKAADIPKPILEGKAKIQKKNGKSQPTVNANEANVVSAIAGRTRSNKKQAAPATASAATASASKQPAQQPSSKEKKAEKAKSEQRKREFQKQFPGVAPPTGTITKKDFKSLVQKHSR